MNNEIKMSKKYVISIIIIFILILTVAGFYLYPKIFNKEPKVITKEINKNNIRNNRDNINNGHDTNNPLATAQKNALIIAAKKIFTQIYEQQINGSLSSDVKCITVSDIDYESDKYTFSVKVEDNELRIWITDKRFAILGRKYSELLVSNVVTSSDTYDYTSCGNN